MSGLHTTYLIVLAVCVVGSGFFSGSETALVAVPRERVEQMTGRRADYLSALTRDYDRTISTLLVANNFVNILGASIATVLFVDLLGEDWGPWIATAAVTAVVLLVGEITPKTLATRHPEGFSLVVAPVIWTLSRVLQPISRLFLALSRAILWVFGVRGQSQTDRVTEDDIRAMALMSERGGHIASAEREIIHAVFSLADRVTREVMTPRTDMVTLSSPLTYPTVQAAVVTTGHSRFPVVKDDVDEVIGVLHVKDLVRLLPEPSTSDIHRVLREPYFVPESTPLLTLLHDLRTQRKAFAMVLDEHGGVEGLITIKDIVSELVGELQDEYDPGSPSIVPIGDSSFLADGRLSTTELASALDIDVPPGPYTTVGGWYLHQSGRIPAVGDSILVDGVRLRVLQMDRRRIGRLQVDRIQR